MANRQVTLYYLPNTRATGVLTLLEELQADYRLHVLDRSREEHHGPEYLAINPMGKVPAITHDGAVVTEQVAIYLYLADLYSEAGLAPPIGDPLRGPYLRWTAFYGSCFEPAVVDVSQKRAPAPRATSPYADFDTMLGALTQQLGRGDYMLGSRFYALDVLWGTALTWMTAFKLVPPLPVIEAYIGRVNDRPAFARVRAKDAELSAK